MKLSISNIAWDTELNSEIYNEMYKQGYQGLEIAPTKVCQIEPYSNIDRIKEWWKEVKKAYGFQISSIQSIWYGRKENIFSSESAYNFLIDYTERAIELAGAIECHNIVFGCPYNRRINGDFEYCYEKSKDFFRRLGDTAIKNNTVIAIEPIPVSHNTNFLNTTIDAINYIRELGTDGVKLNLDIGTMISNEESSSIISTNVDIINHIHISEPGLLPIQERVLHKEIIKYLKCNDYKGFLSIEMRENDFETVKSAITYLRGISEI